MKLTPTIAALSAIVAGAPMLPARPARALIDRVTAKAFETREVETVSEWAKKYRHIPGKVSATPGLIDLAKTPYLIAIMDAFSDPVVREIFFMKSVQVGGTTAADTMPLWAVDQSPGPCLWLAPNATLAGEAAKDRIEPAAKMSPATRDRIGEGTSETKEDVTSKKIDFDLMRMTFAGSGTKNSTIARAIKYGFIDDFDRCESYSYKQMLDRVTSFEDHKIVGIGNPTFEGVGIASHYARSNRQYFAVPCPHPHCRHEHELAWKNLRWKGGLAADPEEVAKTAWMQCPKCKGRIENHHKPAMLREGRWIAERPEVKTRVGFRISALYSPFQPFGWVAKEFLDSGGKPDFQWVNNVLGLPWKNRGKSIDIKALKALAGAARGGGLEDAEGEKRIGVGGEGWCATRVPSDCCVLCAGVDVQEEYTYVLVMGFSPYGLRAYYIDRFTLPASEKGTLLSIADEVRSRRYQRMDGHWQRILLQAWDTGHRAVDVYGVARAYEAVKSCKFVLVKGQGSLGLTKPWWFSTPETVAAGSHAEAAGVTILNINTRAWKDKVADAVRAAANELGVGNAKEDREKDVTHNESALAEAADASDAGAGVGAGSVMTAPVATNSATGGFLGVVMSSIFFPPDVPEDVLEHFAAEHLVKEGNAERWVKITEGLRNEAFDLAYYLGAVGDANGMRTFGMDRLQKSITPPPTEDQIRAWGVRSGSGGVLALPTATTAPTKPVAVRAARPHAKPAGSERLEAVRRAIAARRR